MATNRTRRRQNRRLGPLSPRTRERLLSGCDFEFLAGDPLDLDALREVYHANRAELIADHVAAAPRSRPWAWWRWDSPEPRRELRTGAAAIGRNRSYGIPDHHDGPPARGQYETEAEYLSRLGLLTPEEQE